MNSFSRSVLTLFQAMVCLLAVTGCGMLRSSIVSDNSKIDAEIELAERSQELATELKDFQALKPSLTRLVALELDLNFLLDEISRFSESNPVVYNKSSRTPASELSKVPSGNNVVYKSDGSMASSADRKKNNNNNISEFETRNLEFDLLRLQQNLASAKPGSSPLSIGESSSRNNNNQDVEVASAKRILSIDKSRSNKFQGNQGPNAIVGNIENVNLSKFSSQSPTNGKLPIVDKCANQQTTNSNNFALHLASYKNLNNAKSGWVKLRQKYASTWCDASAKLETVNVKGIDYFSLRVGGYASKDAANQMCSRVKIQGDYCQVASFSGVEI
jgi:hypothetical protein